MANNFCYVKQFMYKRNNTLLVQVYGLSFQGQENAQLQHLMITWVIELQRKKRDLGEPPKALTI